MQYSGVQGQALFPVSARWDQAMPALNIVTPGGVAAAKRQFWWISAQVAFFTKARATGDGQAKSAMQQSK